MNEQVNQETGEVTQVPVAAQVVMDERPPPKLCKALVAAQAVAKAVSKNAENKFHRYKYASAEAVIEEAKECLAQADLGILATDWYLGGAPFERVEVGKNGKKTVSVAGRIFVSYLIIHGESGESLRVRSSSPVVLESGRPEDKAEFGALTQNLAYTLRAVLLLPREDESTSVDTRDDRARDDDRDRDRAGRDDDRDRGRSNGRDRRDDRPDDRSPPSGRGRRDERRADDDPTSFPPRETGERRPEPKRVDPKVMVDDAVDAMGRLEAEFRLGDKDERMRCLRELELIPPRLLQELGEEEPEMERARAAYKPIVRGMRAQLGIPAPQVGGQGAQK